MGRRERRAPRPGGEVQGLLPGRAKLAYTCAMRIVGQQNRSEIELDPLKNDE